MSAQPLAVGDARARPPVPLTFDRATGRLAGATWVERAANLAMQLGLKATGPFHHRGLSFGCRVIRVALAERDIVVRLSGDSVFSFPFGDGYWTRLLDRGLVYEPEIDAFLRAVAGVDYAFIDCGANFGLWSILVTSADYGGHSSLAIEASGANVARLRTNARLNGDRFTVLHRAVARTDGGTAWLAGTKHEGMSIAGTGAGEGEEVAVISLDGLLDRGLVTAGRPIVVKLDVEGVEIEAIKGGLKLLAGNAVLMCEDHGADRTHRVTRFLMSETPWALFAFDPRQGRFQRLTDLAVLGALKAAAPEGYNIFAATSRFWEERLAAAASSARH